MGLMDAFNADERVEVKVGELWDLMDTATRARYLENGIKAGVPVEYLNGMITGEPVPDLFTSELEELEGCCGGACDIHFPDEEELGVEDLFEEKVTMYQSAEEGNIFVLTSYGLECTPEKVKVERAEGKPVKGYEHRVPVSWIEKAYVREVKDEGEAEKVSV